MTKKDPNFASLARARLKQLGLTQQDLANRLGYKTQGGVSSYLTGRRTPTLTVVYAWARALECSPRDLVPEEAPAEDPVQQPEAPPESA